MKFLKGLLSALGLVALVVGGWFFFRSWEGVSRMMIAANTNRSEGFPSPWNLIALATGLALLAGLLLGLALGLPGRLAGAIRKEALMSNAVQRANNPAAGSLRESEVETERRVATEDVDADRR